MKKIQRNEMKKVKGGADREACLKKCRLDYEACIADGIEMRSCYRDKTDCSLRCMGSDPIFP